MFSKLEVRNTQGALLTLQLGDASSGINILDVTGLDPVKATFASSSFANLPGAVFQASRRDTRNITMKLGLDPDPTVTTVRTLRQTVYKFLRSETDVNLTFYFDDTTEVYVIDGKVETCASNMFTEDPVIDVSIICFKPDFRDPVPITVSGVGDNSSIYVPYAGTSPTGVLFTINIGSNISEFNIYYTDANSNTTTLEFAATLLTGDVVTINTVTGSKNATLLRAGVTSSILYAISPQSVWPQLLTDDNWFNVWAEATAFPVSFEYTKLFGEL